MNDTVAFGTWGTAFAPEIWAAKWLEKLESRPSCWGLGDLKSAREPEWFRNRLTSMEEFREKYPRRKGNPDA